MTTSNIAIVVAISDAAIDAADNVSDVAANATDAACEIYFP